ncbi:MAG: hypothetical protein L3J52_04250 [Proteobacteria bacterium]|nr:hypothetical protein [Pseudomonadota bacterium]
MRYFKKIALLFMFFSGTSQAFTPESGFWWNPEESGSGYSIEIQDNFIFVAFYVYDEFGNPTWYSANGFLDGNSFFDAFLNYTFNGSCIDCTYTRPITLHGDGGPVTIEFLTETTGTIQFGGAIKNFERFSFYLGNELEKMLGEWQVVADTTGFTDSDVYPYFADVLIFNQTEVFEGDSIVTGCRSESTVFNNCTNFAYNNEIAAYYDSVEQLLYVVVDDSDDYFLTYVVKTGFNQFDGFGYYYLKGTQPDFGLDGYLVRGFRSASRSFVDSGVGPSKTTASKQSNSRSYSLPLSKTAKLNELDEKQLKMINIIKKLEAQLKK